MPPDQAPGRPLPRGPLVLLVEDEVLVALHLEHLLGQRGWRVLGPAATVAQALHLLGEGEAPAVALLDLNLRGELVVPVAEALRARSIPFVLASAYRVDQVAPALAGVPNVGKPFDEGRLLRRPGAGHRALTGAAAVTAGTRRNRTGPPRRRPALGAATR